jgi:hypothetical protein
MHFRRKSKHESGIECQTHKVYSLTCEDFDALWARSEGKCEACGQTPSEGSRRGLVIDHDHRYGNAAVRGLICRWCNSVLGQLENPDVHPAFGSGPGRWFTGYFVRAWFVRHRPTVAASDDFLDREQLHDQVKAWRKYNKALFSSNPKAALVPLDQPAAAARILREQLSHQAFGALVRAVNQLAEPPRTPQV